ncbi:MAG TPA: hypothetical protein VJV21_02140 [Pyrinomonadaceae bacterium]|nr:hypothetical protein [Pyrinomonadaceae bacterium]
MNTAFDQDLLTRFLLDELDERERAEVEDRLLAETEFYEQMLAREAELTDAYVRGELSHSERERFEKSFFASRDRRKRVEFAQGLADSATLLQREESTKPDSAVVPMTTRNRGWLASLFARRPALGYALAAALLVVIGISVWFAVERMRARVEPQRAGTNGAPSPEAKQDDSGVASRQSGEARPAPGSVNATAGESPTPGREDARDRPMFSTVTLVPGSLRGGTAGANLFITREATHVRVRLQLEEDSYRSYEAVVSTPEGRKVWAGSARKDREKNAQFLTLTLPAGALSRGDYIIELTATTAGARSQAAAQYSFRVTRED